MPINESDFKKTRIPSDLAEEVDKHAALHRSTFTKQVVKAVEEYLQNHRNDLRKPKLNSK